MRNKSIEFIVIIFFTVFFGAPIANFWVELFVTKTIVVCPVYLNDDKDNYFLYVPHDNNPCPGKATVLKIRTY